MQRWDDLWQRWDDLWQRGEELWRRTTDALRYERLYARADHWVRTSPVVDWLYLVGLLAVPLLAAYILAYK